MQMTQEFDKYYYYQESVQSPTEDAAFLEQAYWDSRQKKPVVMREDFCAAFALCCAWVQRDPSYKALGIDLDNEPLKYGREHYLTNLSDTEKRRLELIQGDVLNPELPRADIISAMNFSYFGFKTRPQLLNYFQSCQKALNVDGILILDCFGGQGTMEPNEHETEHENFSYYWDQDTYNPLTNEALFYIHFKRKGEPKRERVFQYDWRLWSLAELADLLCEAGFKNSHVYWEGTDEDGDGNGIFTRTNEGEECESWVAYIVAEK